METYLMKEIVLAAVSLAALAASGAAAPEWAFTPVDGGTLPDSTGTPLSLRLDGADHPHIAYTASFNLPHDYRYAWYDGDAWHVETFDAWPYNFGTFFADISLALDDQAHPHIAYTKVNSPEAELLYAHHDGVQWQIETVTDAYHSQYCSLALDSDGDPHIAFYHSTPDRDLMYASRDGRGWLIEPVDTAGWVGYYCRLALDSEDHPHIAYRQGTAHTLKYAHHDGTGWSVTTVNDPADAIGYGISLALDSQDRPHIACTANVFTDSLLYSYFDGEAWHNETVADACRASLTSIAIDSNDRPHIAYDFAVSDDGPNDHRYAWFDGQSWQTALVEAGYGYGMDHGIALDDCDRPHIAFGRRTDLYNAWLVYARPVMGCVGDVNGDGVVDTADLLALLAAWGDCPDPPQDCPADFDGDGDVDTADLLILLAHWG
jgi:hypothetical protein